MKSPKVISADAEHPNAEFHSATEPPQTKIQQNFPVLFLYFSSKILRVIFMDNNKKNSLTETNPYRFDLTGDFIKDGHNKIASKKSRTQTEAKIKKENSK